MKFSRKNSIFLLLLLIAAIAGAYFWHQYTLSRLPVIGLHKNDKGGYTFGIDGRPFLVRGVCYNPIPVGKDYEYNFWTDPGKPWLADGKLMKEMGVNAVRLYRLPEKDTAAAKKGIHDLYTKYGIRSFVGHYLGFWDWPPANYSSRAYRDNMKRRVIEMVRTYKDEPGIVGWILGNENNYSFDRSLRVWSDDRIDAIQDPEQRRIEMAKVYYSFVNDVAAEVKKVDPSRPVVLGVGEVKSLDIAAERTPNVDIIGMIAYRGATFGNLFRQVKKLYDKPLLITEYGADRFNAYTREEDGASQARFLELQWRDIERNSTAHSPSGNAIGGIIFEWSDEWWKANENLAHTWTIHDQSAQWSHSGYYYDYEAPGRLNINEEWWGIVSFKTKPESLKTGIDKRVLTPGYEVMKGLWNNERKDPPDFSAGDQELLVSQAAKRADLAGALLTGGESTASTGSTTDGSSGGGSSEPSGSGGDASGSSGGGSAGTGAADLVWMNAPAILPPGREWGNSGWVPQPNGDGSVSFSGPAGEKIDIPAGADAFAVTVLEKPYLASVTPRQELILEPKGADTEPLQTGERFDQKSFDASGSQTGPVRLLDAAGQPLALVEPGTSQTLTASIGDFQAFLTEKGYPVLVSAQGGVITVPAGTTSFDLAGASYVSAAAPQGGIGISSTAAGSSIKPVVLTVGAFQPIAAGQSAFMGTALADGSLAFIPATHPVRVVYPSGDMLRPIKVAELTSGRFALESGGRVFVVQGVRYGFTPIGKGPDYRAWNDATNPWREDGKWMKEAGVNTVLLEVTEDDDFVALRDFVSILGSEYGIRSIIQYRPGERRGSLLDYSNPDTTQKLAKAFQTLVDTMKSEPALLGWVIGRRANLAWEDGSIIWRSPGFDRIADERRRRAEMQKVYTGFAEELAKAVHREDAGRPVWMGLTETASLATVAQAVPSVSGFAIETRRTDDLAAFFEEIKQSTSKPVLVTGIGGTRWNPIEAREDESTQAETILTQWNAIEKRTALREGPSPALGAVLAAWTDSWWPASASAASWSVQDAPTTAAADQTEWAGIVALEPALAGSGQADRRVLQEGYQAVKKLWSSEPAAESGSLGSGPAASSLPNAVAFAVRKSEDSWIGMVAGKEQLVRGVVYRPIPAGQGGTYDFWADPEKPWLADGKLLKEMGANAILIQLPSDRRSDPRDLIRDLYERYGIQTFVSFGLSGPENQRSLHPGLPADQRTFEAQVIDSVRLLRNESGVAGWVLGRDENRSFDYNLNPWSLPEWDSIRDGDVRRQTMAKVYYGLMNRAAAAIKKEDSSRLVMLGVHEIRSLDIAAAETPAVDALAVAARRGLAFGSLFDEIRKAYDKPVLVAGFGADRWNTLFGAEDQDSQAWFVSVQWRDIVRHSSANGFKGANAVGGFVHEWTDEWWRSDPNHPTTWSVQDSAAQNTEPAFDYDYQGPGHLNVQEEWWGITAREGQSVSPRKAYQTLKGLWATADDSASCPVV